MKILFKTNPNTIYEVYIFIRKTGANFCWIHHSFGSEAAFRVLLWRHRFCVFVSVTPFLATNHKLVYFKMINAVAMLNNILN